MEDDQTKMMKEGYTESEIAAANWRKQNKLEMSTTDSSAVRRVIRRNDDRRDGRRRSRSTGRNDHRQNFSSDDKRQDNKSLSDIEAPTIDEFGRTILPGQKISSNKNTDKDNRRNRSRSRSHDHRSRRSDSRNRSRSRSNTQPYSRENSRSRSRSYSPRYARKSESKWGHDKYDNHQAPEEHSPRRRIADDYQPPSPEWISKAGGIAIMRKRTTQPTPSSTSAAASSSSKLFKS